MELLGQQFQQLSEALYNFFKFQFLQDFLRNLILELLPLQRCLLVFRVFFWIWVSQ